MHTMSQHDRAETGSQEKFPRRARPPCGLLQGLWAALSGHAWQPAAVPLVAALAARIRYKAYDSRAHPWSSAVTSVAGRPDQPESSWQVSEDLAYLPLTLLVPLTLRQRTLGVLSAAYSTIQAGRAAAFLGLPEADAISREWLCAARVAASSCSGY